MRPRLASSLRVPGGSHWPLRRLCGGRMASHGHRASLSKRARRPSSGPRRAAHSLRHRGAGRQAGVASDTHARARGTAAVATRSVTPRATTVSAAAWEGGPSPGAAGARCHDINRLPPTQVSACTQTNKRHRHRQGGAGQGRAEGLPLWHTHMCCFRMWRLAGRVHLGGACACVSRSSLPRSSQLRRIDPPSPDEHSAARAIHGRVLQDNYNYNRTTVVIITHCETGVRTACTSCSLSSHRGRTEAATVNRLQAYNCPIHTVRLEWLHPHVHTQVDIYRMCSCTILMCRCCT